MTTHAIEQSSKALTASSAESLRLYRTVERAIAYLHQHAEQQPSLAELAVAVHMSESHLQRVFSQWAGISPKRFLQYLNKNYARAALQQSHDVLSVSHELGLSSPSRLHDLMVSCEAMSPGEIQSGGAGLAIYYGCAPTPFGEALFGWCARGVCYLAFLDDDLPMRQQELNNLFGAADFYCDEAGACELAQKIFPAVNARCVLPARGELHLLLRGTNFQIKVWEALIHSSSARLQSYGQLAHQIGAGQAQRAIGSALAANHIGWLIPCHRVLRATGEVGAYRWNSTRKSAMLAFEAGRADNRAK